MIYNKHYNSIIKVSLAFYFILCVALTINLWFYFQPSSTELQFADWLQFGRPDWLTLCMHVVSDSYILLSLIAGGYCLRCLAMRRYAAAMAICLSLASLLLIDPLKSLFQRPRPVLDPVIYDLISGTSFPSGHAIIATVLTGTILLIYLTFNQVSKTFYLPLVGMLYVLLVSWSRVYLQAHYPSDVLGGILFGLMILIFISFIFQKLQSIETMG